MQEEKSVIKNRERSCKEISEEEKIALCEKWKNSGIKRSHFCKEHGLSPSTFYGWCNKSKTRKNKASSSNFVAVNSVGKIENKEESQVEIILPNQAMIRIKLSMGKLLLFIRELCNATTVIR